MLTAIANSIIDTRITGRDIDLNIIRNKFQGGTTTVRAKIYVLNDFYNLNKVIVFKKDPQLENGKYSPVSMMFRYKPWTVDDMYEHMKEIAETSFRYYTQ